MLQQKLKRELRRSDNIRKKYQQTIHEFKEKDQIPFLLTPHSAEYSIFQMEPTSRPFTVTRLKTSLAKSKHEHRFNYTEKSLFISLYFQDPKAYKYMRWHIIALPHLRTLDKRLGGVAFQPGFNTTIFHTLVDEMKPEETSCCLPFDEISSKEGLMYNPGEDSTLGIEEFVFL